MEELLNKLIDKGWRPRGLTPMGKMEVDYDIYFAFDVYDSLQCGHFSFREITSKESGLWQFVCENEMVPKECHERVKDISWGEYGPDCKEQINLPTAEYRLIESALCDEDKLEDFILDNVKIRED